MTIVIVNPATGEFIRTEPSAETVVGFDGLNHRLDEPVDDLRAAGIYAFSPDERQPPYGKRESGATFNVDQINGVVTELFIYVDMTPDEIKAETNAEIDAQLLAKERQAIETGALRTVLEVVQGVLLKDAQAAGLTEAQLLDKKGAAYSPAYARLHANSVERDALRAKRLK